MSVVASITGTPERRVALALLLFLCTLYLPFAGNYGMWDPWETHYSEVARQMVARGDFVSLWWPGSPQDRNEFWSKPVLTFWLIALGFKVAGLGGHHPAIPSSPGFAQLDGEMAVGWTAEWAARMPFILCGIAAVWAVWELVRRLAGRRAAMWSAIVLATSSQFFLVARQAMTDMAFVAPMVVALLYAGLAVMLPDEEVGAPLPRRSYKRLSWPDAPIFYVLLGMVALLVVPQLVLCSLQLRPTFVIGRRQLATLGVVVMLPWIAALAAFLYFGARARTRRQIYLHIAFLMCGISTLAKGPAGLGLPVIVLFVYLLAQGQLGRLLPGPADPSSPSRIERMSGPLGFALRLVLRNPLEIGLGLLIFIATAFPWYHAMLTRHGMGFWNEFIGDNYVHRAAGRHGDRGTFDYYLLQIGHGMFPWAAFVGAGLLAALRRFRGDDPRTRLRNFALAWFLVIFAVMSLVNTKFHHYILPGLPALAILAGLLLDDLFTEPDLGDVLGLLGVGVPFLVLAARDLAMYPARILWLFCYDYVNAPNGGRPWPSPSIYGQQYEYGSRIAAFAVVVTAATLLCGAIALYRAWPRRAPQPELPDGDEAGAGPYRTAPPLPEAALPDDDAGGLPGLQNIVLVAIPIATLVAAQLWQPRFGKLPTPLDNGWILVGAAASLFLLIFLGRAFRQAALLWPTIGLAVVAVAACFWSGWTLDRLLTDVSPHWSQKQVIAAYYQNRQSADEPLIAWQMYWRGETFYSKNAIYDHRMDQRDKTVFLGDHNAEKLQEYFKTHAGRRVFFIVERTRLEALRALLPEAARSSLRAIDESNNKVYLAVAQI